MSVTIAQFYLSTSIIQHENNRKFFTITHHT